MAARDALRRLFGTGEENASLPFGDKARKFSNIINGLYDKFNKKANWISKNNKFY